MERQHKLTADMTNLAFRTADANPGSEESFFASLYDAMPALCMMLDEKFSIARINRFGCEQLGYERAELIGQPLHLLSPQTESEFLTDRMQTCLQEGNVLRRWEIMRRRRDGSTYWARDTVRFIQQDNGDRLILLVSEDITETRYLINELERQSSVDGLTGLFSRRKFDRLLEQTVLSSQIEGSQHVLCFMDLDQFKTVNDTAGHMAGDELLQQVAYLLQSHIRSNDILARLGGDEFGLILTSCSLVEAVTICRKILDSISKYHFVWNKDNYSIGASIGMVAIAGGDEHSSELLRQADTACYMAKDKGRNCIQLYDIEASEAEDRGRLMKWVSRLHWAFDQDRFVLHRQRILPIGSNQAESPERYELLIRLCDEQDELVYPGAFMSAIEYYGMASRLDMWVTRKALQSFAASHDANDTPPMYYINLSGLTLGDNNFIREISKLFEQHKDNMPQVCFEITETAAIQNLTSAIRFIEHFRAMGCFFALDDFGSGFSSFAYLKSLPVDFIKIDGEFIKNIMNEPMDMALVKAIHDVAGVFGKQTIAEYVENGQILNIVKGLGIDYAQGFHVDKPSPFIDQVDENAE